jgi:Zn-dependent protease
MSMREAGELAPGECPRCHGDMKVVAKEVPQELSEQLALVARCFDIEDFIAAKDRVELAVAAPNAKRSFRSVLDAAKKRGYLPVMREREGELRLLMIKSPRVKKGNVLINLLLFFATIGTTFAAGYYFLFGNTLYAALFSGSLLFMLGSHELGHKIAAWHNGVEATLPYFIPAPTILGTFGAVISVKSPIPTKEALVEMGASGPLFGFFVALPITIIGLMQNPTAPDFGFTPAIFAMLQLLTFGHMPVGGEVNPLAFAGWVLLFVTMFNLFPVGQLDGGHVARGLLNRERHFTLTKVSAFSLIMFGFIISSPLSPTLWLWGLLILLIFRGYHTGALDDVSKLSKNQKWLAAVTFVVFLLCVPIPTG